MYKRSRSPYSWGARVGWLAQYILDVTVLTDTNRSFVGVFNRKGAVMKRKRISKRKSAKLFKRTTAPHPRNFVMPMRGGVRLT